MHLLYLLCAAALPLQVVDAQNIASITSVIKANNLIPFCSTYLSPVTVTRTAPRVTVTSTTLLVRTVATRERSTQLTTSTIEIDQTARVQATSVIPSLKINTLPGSRTTTTTTQTSTLVVQSASTVVTLTTNTVTPRTRTGYQTLTSYVWPPPPQKRALLKNIDQSHHDLNACENERRAFKSHKRGHNNIKLKRAAALPAKLTPYPTASVSAACARLVSRKTSTTTVAAATRTVLAEQSSTVYTTQLLVGTQTVRTSRTSTVSTSTQYAYVTSVSTSIVQLPDTTSTVVSNQISTSYDGVTPSLVTSTILTTLAASRTTILSYATVTVSPVAYDYHAVTFPNGIDTLPDYSYAGYHASNDPLPDGSRPATLTLSSTNDATDRTGDIQNLINNCGNGGIIELGPGNYTLNGSLNLKGSNCVLRGVNQQDSNGDPVAVLVMVGSPKSFVNVGPTSGGSPKYRYNADISDPYVPVGATSFNVSDASNFVVGDKIVIIRTVSAQWLHVMGMDDLIRANMTQTWLAINSTLHQYRVINNIQGNAVTVDFPLTDAVNMTVGDQGRISSYQQPAVVAEVGIENLWIDAEPDGTGEAINEAAGQGKAIVFNPWSIDSWVRNVVITGFNNPITVNKLCARLTIVKASFRRDMTSDTSAGAAADVNVAGQQILVTGCNTQDRNGSSSFETTTGSDCPGPNVATNHWSLGTVFSSPHMRWATGFLLDNSVVAQSSLWNRGTAGSGHGWTVGAGMNWNVVAPLGFGIQQPPTSQNFCVGCIGPILSGSTGSITDQNQAVWPQSLFQAQLIARIGSAQAQLVTTY